MAAHSFIGTWEVVGCISQSGNTEKTGIEGTLFCLDESGDVIWTVPEETEAIPLFSCETYEIYSTSLSGVVIRFGAYAGHVIDFRVDHPEPQDVMLLTCEGWYDLHCKRVVASEPEPPVDSPFSLLPALEDGYFSDLSIMASNNKQFPVHTCILRLSAPELDWSHQPPPLSGLPEDVLGTILHFLYAECLPTNLGEQTARHCIAAATSLPGLERLVRMCELYLKNMALKQQIIGFVSDMHACASQIIDHFSTKTSAGEHSADSLNSNPAKLCFVVKQSVREAAVAGVKLLLLCDLFTKRKAELSREERHEIIRYAKSRLPVFMSQLLRFLQGVKSTFSSMSPSQRQEVATYLVPEIETILDTVSALAVELKSALEQIILTLSPSEGCRSQKGNVGEVLGKSLKNVLHIRELSKLRSVHQRITFSLVHLLQKKESFSDMTSANKVRSVARNLEQLIEELPIFLLRLEEVTAALDDKLEWREFKFCFKVGTSKVSGVLQKLLTHSSTLQDVLVQLCDLVQRDTFTQSLFTLGLLDPAQYGGSAGENNRNGKSHTHSTPKQHGYKLNLVESLCIPPMSRTSLLSKSAIQLLSSGQATDMVFEVVASQEPPDCVIDHTQSQAVEASPADQQEGEEVCSIQAHRVIVAARCDWFRRALLSGMREAIDRKIVIHDTSPFLFSTFLNYLYSGQLETKDLSVDQLADLMLLSDRYEVDSLKQACEQGLKRHIDEDSVLYFLSMGDQFNAKLLRSACLNFIFLNPDIIDSDLFEELPQNLQAEIYDLVIWAKPRKSQTTEKLLPFPECPSPETPTSVSSSLADIEEMASNIHINSREVEASDSSSLEELPLTQDSARLERCLVLLRDIIGEQVSREELVQVVLAADYDINRALNFYYSS
ncbi:uncharacterized protein LOC110835411 [Zootermopsis nevadensis]|uniref:Kelch repeat and BTB domain-containing protein 4 n=1 Tax=Zootermopsis nevadensis TaxID=136037 RepID=A0A067QU79_ZOONE|nr:uncharacterized protein LOC110835411 [Zootermopsis nevadensis]KDR13429.1 Kelch repeat and BTB domain-containing protein 4 [Zootermopsis nevadensis]